MFKLLGCIAFLVLVEVLPEESFIKAVRCSKVEKVIRKTPMLTEKIRTTKFQLGAMPKKVEVKKFWTLMLSTLIGI